MNENHDFLRAKCSKEFIEMLRPLMGAPSGFLLSIPMLAKKYVEQHGGVENVDPDELSKIQLDVSNAMDEIAYRN